MQLFQAGKSLPRIQEVISNVTDSKTPLCLSYAASPFKLVKYKTTAHKGKSMKHK